MPDTVAPFERRKVMLRDDWLTALHVPSGATGSMFDVDCLPSFQWSPTSDAVSNCVDELARNFVGSRRAFMIFHALDDRRFEFVRPRPIHMHREPLAPDPESFVVALRIASQPMGEGSSAIPSVEELPAEAALEAVAKRLRDRIDFPVADLARMIGIKRRQFYNLLGGGSTGLETESRLRLLDQLTERIVAVVGDDPRKMRAALLTPVGEEAASLFEASLQDDEPRVRRTAEALFERIETRGVKPSRRVIPRATAAATRAERLRRAHEIAEDASIAEHRQDDGGDR